MVTSMSIGLGIFLFVVGAILRFALNVQLTWIDLHLVGNLLMGAVFARYFQRSGRIVPLIAAHTFIDVVAFCGYVLLAGHVAWLPAPR